MKRVIFAEHFMYRLSLRCQSSKSTEFTLNWHGFHFFPFLALKIWALVVLKFFDVVLKFELSRARCLNFPKNSASVLINLVLIIGDCVYYLHGRKLQDNMKVFSEHTQVLWNSSQMNWKQGSNWLFGIEAFWAVSKS